MVRGVFRMNLTPICDRLSRVSSTLYGVRRQSGYFRKFMLKRVRIPMNTGFSAPMPFEIDRAAADMVKLQARRTNAGGFCVWRSFGY